MPTLDADGDRWIVSLDSHPPHPGVHAVVFHCASNTVRPYRVVEVPASALSSQEALDQLSADELERLFADSEPMDYTHDPRAATDHIGDMPAPPGS